MLPILLLSPIDSIAEKASSLVSSCLGDEIFTEVYGEDKEDDNVIEIIQRYPDIEIVISRGGLAERIRALEHISLVEITMSVNDLLHIVSKLTQQGIRRIGIVSRSNLLDGTMGHFSISDVEVSIHSCQNEAEIHHTVARFVSQGIEAIIGCRLAFRAAEQHGVTAIFLESSDISIRQALMEAKRILQAKEREKLQAAQLKAIIDNIEEGVVAVTHDNKISFYNRIAHKICPKSQQGPDFRALIDLLRHGETEQITTINGNSIIARLIPLEIDRQKRGDVITFQEASNIQASETKIRASAYKKGLYAKNTFADIIGETESMRTLVEKAKNYATYDSNLLIYGETGTGKEIFAQSSHNHSKRRNGPFVSVNTASISPSLLESELFGYTEGSFTGARKGGKPGLFELSHGGTIFLDEIGELAPDIQSRLLRVLQEKEIMRIGDDKIIPINTRIICATNRTLIEQVRLGRFRQDLYYRIHVLGLSLPPLRTRTDDIPLLFESFLQRLSHRTRCPSLSACAREQLQSYSWPGNIRQLHNLAEVIIYSDTAHIKARHIIDALGEQEQSAEHPHGIVIPEQGTLKQMEAEIIKKLLLKSSHDDVCRQLGISRVTLWRKMKNMTLA